MSLIKLRQFITNIITSGRTFSKIKKATKVVLYITELISQVNFKNSNCYWIISEMITFRNWWENAGLIPILYKNLERNTKLDFANATLRKATRNNYLWWKLWLSIDTNYAFTGIYLTQGIAIMFLHILNQSLKYTFNSIMLKI